MAGIGIACIGVVPMQAQRPGSPSKILNGPADTAPPAARSRTGDGIAFDIPAQALDTAIARYFRVTGVQLLYDSALAAGRRSTSVRGRHAAPDALRLLLAGTGLVARYTNTGAATIVAARIETPAPLSLGRVVVRERIGTVSLSRLERLAYYDRVEEQLRARLLADPRTAHRAFRIVVWMRIGADGRIVDLRSKRASRAFETERRVIETLDGVIVARPPIGLAQPLSIVLTGRRP